MANQNENRELAIKLTDVKKMYKLGQIGGGTLKADLESWWAKKRGLEDPNTKIGEQRLIGQTFMALNGIDLEVYKGEALGIIGGNGAGKSTMLKLLSRVTAPTSGKIQIWGRIASMLEVGTGFNGEMTGRENIYMNGAILGMTKEEIDAKMEDIIEFSEVRDFIDTPVKRYSSGMYVKLAFSVAAHLDSEIMIMDEVLAVGDMAFQKKCLDKMRDAAKKEGRTVLYVSHNMNTIRQLCDRCVVLDKGRIVYSGDVESAIRVYMGVEANDSYPVVYNLKNIKRLYSFGEKLLIHSIIIEEKEDAVFEIGDRIKMSIEYESMLNIPCANILLHFRDKDYVKLGMAMTERFEVTKSISKLTIEIPTDFLTDGIYCLNVEVVETASDGSFVSYDNPGAKIMVEMTNKQAHGIAWNRNYWGQICFPQLKVVK